MFAGCFELFYYSSKTSSQPLFIERVAVNDCFNACGTPSQTHSRDFNCLYL
jgi:hypothetical protein